MSKAGDWFKGFWKRQAEHLLILAVGIILSMVMAIFQASPPQFVKALDYKVYDTILQQVHTTETSGVPVIIDLDEKALAEFGQWPWPRWRVGLLMAKIAEYGAASVGFDILFAEPDRTSPVSLQKEMKRDLKVDVGFTGLPDQLLDNDKLFAEILRAGPYVLGYFFNFSTEKPKKRECTLHSVNLVEIRKPGTPPATTFLYNSDEPICNLNILSKAAHNSGYYNADPDTDGIMRRTPLIMMHRGKVYPSLALASLMEAMKTKQLVVKMIPEGIESIRLGKTVIPLDTSGRMIVNYRGPKETFKYISAADVLAGRLPANALRGKIALVGTSAAGLKDIRSTPFDPVYPGVEVHATIIDNILRKEFISSPEWTTMAAFYVVLGIGVLSTLLLAWAPAKWSLLPLAGCAVGMWFGALWSMEDKGLYVSPLLPIITVTLNFTVLTLLKFLREEGHKKFLHATFASYLSPELIERMVESKEMPELGGEAKICTAYFTDIQSFSSFSEVLTATQLVELLNEYLSAMTDLLIEENGTLDKYEGDAIIAFFGAPMDLPDHAYRACKVAVHMQNTLLELREKWTTEGPEADEPDRNTKGLPPEVWHPDWKWPKHVHDMKMRIGVNSGEIVVGNMGSAMRMNYTMMGDPVNLSARLEEAAKQYGVYTMVSHFTLDLTFMDEQGNEQRVGDLLETRLLDNIQVVGKEEPVRAYELVALKGGLTEQETKLFDLFNKGMEQYLATEWDKAIELFEQALPIERVPDGKTTPSEVYIKRCKEFKENPPVPPGEAWDGVYRLTKK